MGLITREKLLANNRIAGLCLFIPVLFLVPAMVYFLNGARGFFPVFLQITEILLIQGLFDRLFIDFYWVGHTKAWQIPGTEDLKPYIPKKTLIVKWLGVLVGYPMFAAIASGILLLF